MRNYLIKQFVLMVLLICSLSLFAYGSDGTEKKVNLDPFEVVFTGKIISTQYRPYIKRIPDFPYFNGSSSYYLEFEVSRVWKGNVGEKFVIVGLGGSSCSSFSTNEEYLIVGYIKDGIIFTRCTDIRECKFYKENEPEVLLQLGPGRKPTPTVKLNYPISYFITALSSSFLLILIFFKLIKKTAS